MLNKCSKITASRDFQAFRTHTGRGIWAKPRRFGQMLDRSWPISGEFGPSSPRIGQVRCNVLSNSARIGQLPSARVRDAQKSSLGAVFEGEVGKYARLGHLSGHPLHTCSAHAPLVFCLRFRDLGRGLGRLASSQKNPWRTWRDARADFRAPCSLFLSMRRSQSARAPCAAVIVSSGRLSPGTESVEARRLRRWRGDRRTRCCGHAASVQSRAEDPP